MGQGRNVPECPELVEEAYVIAVPKEGPGLSRQQMGRSLQHASVKSQSTF